MALRTKQEYFDSIKQLKTELYAMGEKVNDLSAHPCFRPPLEAIGLVYELSGRKEYEDSLTARSPFISDKINRFAHILQEQDDLAKRFRIARFMVHKHGACIGARCVSTGALNSVFAATYDMDRELGTAYHNRFLDFLKFVQKNDLAVCGAMMDVKGDRSLSPGKQPDPDAYLHIVEKRKNGIVVRGAKASISGAAIANEIVVLPCTALQPGEESYAVCFAVPSDVPTEHRIRMMRLVEYLSGQGSVVPIESTHGAGSPQAQRIVIQNTLMNAIERFKKDAKVMAGIE
jgi:4-hydroxybutyryl-CoA dehydratase/vinylacetyl-CoA-Delta-isomerase